MERKKEAKASREVVTPIERAWSHTCTFFSLDKPAAVLVNVRLQHLVGPAFPTNPRNFTCKSHSKSSALHAPLKTSDHGDRFFFSCRSAANLFKVDCLSVTSPVIYLQTLDSLYFTVVWTFGVWAVLFLFLFLILRLLNLQNIQEDIVWSDVFFTVCEWHCTENSLWHNVRSLVPEHRVVLCRPIWVDTMSQHI